MPIDFTLTMEQKRLQADARAFARDVLTRLARLRAACLRRWRASRRRGPFTSKSGRGRFCAALSPPPSAARAPAASTWRCSPRSSMPWTQTSRSLCLAPCSDCFQSCSQAIRNSRRASQHPSSRAKAAPSASFCFSEPGRQRQFRRAPAGRRRANRGVPCERRRRERLDHHGREEVAVERHGLGWRGRGPHDRGLPDRSERARPSGDLGNRGDRPRAGRHAGERAIDSIGHRAHLLPEFRLNGVRTSADNVIGSVGGGKGLVEACFSGTAPIVGMFAVGLMRAAFDAALTFARTERRGGAVPIIEYQAVGYALADAKTAIEAVRTLSWRAAHAVDAHTPGALELALHAKVFGSETAVRIITDLMRVVGVDSYDHDMPLGGLLVDALVLPLFDGGNMGVRRRQLHDLVRAPGYDPLAAAG